MGEKAQSSWLLDAQPKIGLRNSFANVSMRLFASIVLPLTAVFVLAFALEYRAQVRAERARITTHEAAVIQRGVRWVERELEIATGDALLFADLVEEALGGEPQTQRALIERSALAFLRGRSAYFEARVLDADGREWVRAEIASNGPRIASESALGDERDRSHFTEAIALDRGAVFVSRMELNADSGAIAEPYVPVVRLATPVDDASGRWRGVVVLNARGEHFLRAFEPDAEERGIERMIVDSDGYWLRHRPEMEWGFALEHASSFRRSFPEVWEQLQTHPRGEVEVGEGIFYFDFVRLRQAAPNDRARTPEAERWLFISLVPRRVLDEIAIQAATPLLVTAMPMYFALLVIAWALAAALQRRRLSEEALRGFEAVRSAMMRAALDGIVVMDKTGTALEFNRSALEIFGYTREEVRGRPVAELIIPPAHREAHRAGLEHYLETGEGPIIDKHIDELTAIRKGGEEFPVELTVCPVMVAGRQLFCGFLRDLGERPPSAG